MKTVVFLLTFAIVSLASDFTKSIKAVMDTKHQLMWQDDEEVMIQEDITMAKVYCETLILNGYTDWYLPSIKQLQWIIDIQNKKGFIQKEFQYFKEDKYWAKTPFIGDGKLFWYVDFQTGKSNFMAQETQNYIRCVRDINE